MTCREWMQQNHPERVNGNYNGGVCGCPHEYGLIEKFSSRACKNIFCESCWDRPVTNAAPVSFQPGKEPPVDRGRLLIALEHCRNRESNCHTCPLFHDRYSCIEMVNEEALAYIYYLEEALGIG